ncbi:MAG TPA: nodulation protein NfeD [Chloroflexota bacterium]
MSAAWLRWGSALCLAVLLLIASPQARGAGEAFVVALDGPIGPATADYVVRALQAAEKSQSAVVILRLDTPGGLDSAMRTIIRGMLASPVPVLAYVAPGGARAASAGTYILYASALAAMAPGTNLGAATPVPLFGDNPSPPGSSQAPQPAPDAERSKVVNDAAAYIRGLAVLHGRNPDWAERAVRESVSIPYDEALREHVIEVEASSVAELLTLADGRTVLAAGHPVRLATRDVPVLEIVPDWRDRLLGILTDPTLLYLLLLAGIVGVAFELTHPGIFAPGVLGAICLLVGGYGLNLLPIDYAGAALAVFGLGLIVAEAFVPAFGAFVLGGAAAFLIGSLMMFRAPGLRPPWALIVGATLASVVLLGVVLGALLRSRRRPVVSGDAGLLHLEGRVTAWQGTEGQVMLRGEYWNARSARPLAVGDTVRVIGRDGLRLLVDAMKPPVGRKI